MERQRVGAGALMGLFPSLDLLKPPPVDHERRRALADWVVRVLEEQNMPTDIARCLLVATLKDADGLMDTDEGVSVVINYLASLQGMRARDFRCSPGRLH